MSCWTPSSAVVERNPVPIEHLRLLSSQTFGRARAMLDVMHNTPFTDMNDSEGETQAMGYQAFESAYRALDLLAAVMAQVRIDPARVATNIRRSCITITELADSLAREEGLSFREGHEIAAAVARVVVAVDGDLPIDGYAPFLVAFEKSVGRASAINAHQFAELVSPEHFVAVRARYGGPAPAPMAAALASYRAQSAAFANKAETRAAVQARAKAELNSKFDALVGAA